MAQTQKRQKPLSEILRYRAANPTPRDKLFYAMHELTDNSDHAIQPDRKRRIQLMQTVIDNLPRSAWN